VMVAYDDMQLTVDQVQQFVDAGCTHIILNLKPPYPENIAANLAEDVVSKITA
jgi:hypothetical protein